jgi:hypothetical protein
VSNWSQLSANTGSPNAGVAGHSIVAFCGQLVTVGGIISLTVIVCAQLEAFPHASVAVQVRVIILLQVPPGLLWISINDTRIVPSHPSRAVTSAGAGRSPMHWMLKVGAGQPVKTGAALSSIVIVWLQVTWLLHSSFAVHVRVTVCLTLSTQLPGVITSAWVISSEASALSENNGSPKTGVSGHSIVASCGQLKTIGGWVSFTVMV